MGPALRRMGLLAVAGAVLMTGSCTRATSSAGGHDRGATIPLDRPEANPRLLTALGTPGRELVPLFEALERLELGSAQQPISIIQIGDSHTANYALAGRLRELFQTRFGAAGRGMLAAGIPHRWYIPQQVEVTETGGWTHYSSFDRPPVPPFGITGTRERGTKPADRMTLTDSDIQGFDRAQVEILHQPGGGTLDARVDDGAVQSIATGAATRSVEWIDLTVPAGGRRLTLTPHGNGPVDILSWTTQRDVPGIVYENFGTIGATVDLIRNWDPAIVATDLKQRDPALILVAFGTNEGFGKVDPTAYRALYTQRVAMLQKAAPHAAILVMGPADGNRLYRRPPGEPGDCVPSVPDGTPIAPKHTVLGPNAVWAPPPGLAVVRAAERAAAADNGWYFWDWGAAMGGACSMHHWTQMTPPLGFDDHIHLREAGYRLNAVQLFDEIMALYDRYRSLRLQLSSNR